MTNERQTESAVHVITIDARGSLAATGIHEVLSYDVSAVTARCDCGELVIEGAGLLMGSFDQTSGRLTVEGRIDAVHYIESKNRQSLLSRLFK